MLYALVIAFTFAIYLRSILFSTTVDDDGSQRMVDRCAPPPYNKQKPFLHNFSCWMYYLSSMIYGAGLCRTLWQDHVLKIVLTATIGCMLLWCFNVWVALLWVAHPINNQLTVWLNGRRYQVSLLLGLLSYKLPIAGFILFPIAVYIHPISAPILIVTAVTVTPVAWLWSIPALLNIKHLVRWTKARLDIQPFEIYKTFNWGKPIMAVKCLAEYFRHCLFPTGFTMYHPQIWGVAELEGNKARNYAVNAQFWLCVAFVALISCIGVIVGGTCLIGLLIAFVGILPWLGIVINPTQLWAQRYASLMSIGTSMFTYGLCSLIGEQYLIGIVLVYSIITLKDMSMYKDIFSFFHHHALHQPHNQNSAYFGAVGLNNYAVQARKEKKPNEAAIFASNSMALSLMWCIRNPQPDMIHQFALKQIEGANKKPLKKEGA